MGYLTIKSKINLDEAQVGDRIEESDFSTLTDRGHFVQMTYIDEDETIHGEIARPGIFSIVKNMLGFKLEKTEFTKDDVLKDFVSTKDVTDKIDKFFNAIFKYEKYGIFPKRGGLLFGPAGCHAAGTKILMANGTNKNVEDVRVGELLMGPDSKPREVLKLANGFESMVRIAPVKGDPFVVNINHILHLTPSGDSNTTQTPINMSVLDYLKQGSNFRRNYKITRTGVEFADRELPIPAYILGSWLGDGTSAGPEITSMDKNVLDEWQKYSDTLVGHEFKFKAHAGKAETFSITTGKNDGQLRAGRNVLRSFLQDMNLIDNKHIPQLYLTSSRKNRLELLAGLIDTDGSLTYNCFDITQKSNQITEGILFLCRSLGYAAYSSKCVKCDQNGTEGEYNRISISGDVSEIPVRIEYKRASPRMQNKNVLRTGFEIEILEPGNYYGFSLDGDHLYLTSDFTIHHNTGKTTIIAETCRKYVADGKTFILLWHTDKFEAGDVKDFIKHLQYEGVEKMILVVEDIGGVEIDQARIRSESALLSLLDNQESTFKIPVYIAATTNYPENFMGNLTNRPNRFDDKIRVGYPKGSARQQLLKFYDKENLIDQTALDLIASKKCDEFSPAHLREAIIRSAIHDLTPTETIRAMIKEIEEYNKAFSQQTAKFGLVRDED